MSDKNFDVVIVGAGPSGAACAIKLADSGLKVALLDKAVFPRDKTCGDALSLDIINQLPMLSGALVAEFEAMENKLPSYGVKIFSPDHHHIDIPFIYKNEKRCGYISPRLNFDNLLFQHVKQYPAISIFENCAASSVAVKKDAVVIETNLGTFSAQMVIGADGAHSVVSKHLANIKVEKENYSAGLRIYYEGITSFHDENYIELYFFKDILPGYLWIFPLGGNKANVGIGMLSSMVSGRKINLKETLQHLLKTNPQIKARFEHAKPLETVKGYGLPLGSKKRLISGERFLLAGDAAALIDPFTGEGIGNAIRSGRVAAAHAIACFQQNNFSSAFNKAYDKEIYHRMWKEFKISKTLQRVVMYPRLFNFVVKKAKQSKYLQKFLEQSLANVVNTRKIFGKPGFYFRMLFK
ncbi:MAG: geranylgeranyl reductase family protein [Ferruginibacter sp.]